MKIYRMDPMRETYGSFNLNTKAITEAFGAYGLLELGEVDKSIADKWPLCSGAFYNMQSTEILNVMPDIYIWRDCFLVLTNKAKQLLEANLKTFGEFLPIKVNGKPSFIFSSHSIIEEDIDNSELLIESRERVGVKTLSFLPENVGTNPVFKTEFDDFSNIYCSEKFKDTVLNSGLTVGIVFSEDLSSASLCP